MTIDVRMLGHTVKQAGQEVSGPDASDVTRTSRPEQASIPNPATPASDTRRLAPLQIRDASRYDRLGEHGRGGLGRVVRAHDNELGRDVAIKELLERGNTSELRFFREAMITARLEHPGIVPVHEAGRWEDGTPFYAMKLVAGRPLKDLIDEAKTLADRLALLPNVIAIVDAIAYAHDQGIIHRDLKPSNVIVGEFGETVVIDWGLAKLIDEPSTDAPDTPYRVPSRNELTTVGAVLGTPAFMAPEQREGRSDERSDIYAIGGILHHVFFGEPPGQRGTASRAGHARRVPGDLSAIIARALQPSPAARYPSAKELGEDLRRYLQRRPVLARRYSLPARVVLALARHRAVSFAIFVGVVALLVLLAVDNHRVEGQRERAVSSEARTERAMADTERALHDLELRHAELLLASDPSAARDVLAHYSGPVTQAVSRLRAEAQGRGVSILSATPHSDEIRWLRATSDGGAISLSSDGTIVSTRRDGSTARITRGVTPKNTFAYSDARHLLAYACDPNRLCMLDTTRGVASSLGDVLSQSAPDAVAFSANGLAIATLSHGELSVWDIDDLQHPMIRLHVDVPGAYSALFLNEGTVATVTQYDVEAVGANVQPVRAPIASISAWDANDDKLVLGTENGAAILTTSTFTSIAKTTLCDGPVAQLRHLPKRHLIAFSCRDGKVGTWAPGRNDSRILVKQPSPVTVIDVSADGRYLAAGGQSGLLSAIDLGTGLVTSYRGHSAPLCAVSAPTLASNFFTSADANGHLRMWRTPNDGASVALTLGSRLLGVAPLVGTQGVVVSTEKGALIQQHTGMEPRALDDHNANNAFLSTSNDSKYFASFGMSDTVEIWSAMGPTLAATFHTGQGAVSQVLFTGHDDNVFIAGRDGRLMRWSSATGLAEVATLKAGIKGIVPLSSMEAVVAETTDSGLWLVPAHSPPRLLLSRDHAITIIASIGRWLAMGDASGAVELFDTTTWRSCEVLRTSSSIRHIAISPDAGTLAVASRDGSVQVAELASGLDLGSTCSGVRWDSFAAHARYLRFSADSDLLLVANSNGAIWAHSRHLNDWAYLETGDADITLIRLTADGTAAATIDSTGRLLILKLARIRELFHS